ncbi:polysaccharide deacetylase [bacterium]|nr:polysaccharide deacetylase [bacterium]
MKIDWTPVVQEQRLWRAAGLDLPLWWRDDDAIAPTAALDQLIALSDAVGLPVHLAVIPRRATAELAVRVAGAGCLIPVVHGWVHQNHAPAEAKKAEFGATRPPGAALDEARQGLAQLQKLFGARLQAMFVPPWNRIAPEVVAGLAPLGFAAVSTFGPRRAATAAPGLAQINTHLDPIDWRGGRGLVDPADLVRQLAQLMADRRLGLTDNREPLGLLTHHLAHDSATWEFTRQVIMVLLAGPSRPALTDLRA